MFPGCTGWPADVAARYRREGYWRGEVLGDLLRPIAHRDPDRIAVVTTAARATYRELDDRADRLAAGLRELGITKGERVVVQLPNILEFVTVSVALFRLGVLPIYALPAHRRSELTYLCDHTEAAALIVPDTYLGFDHCDLAQEVARACATVREVIVAAETAVSAMTPLQSVDADPVDLPPPHSEEVAFFLLSGGTTGMAKLIPRTHDDYVFQLTATAAAMGFDEAGVYLAALPAAHNAALGCPGVLGALLAGGKAVLSATPSPDEVFPLIEREAVTLTTLMPPLVALWLDLRDLFDVDLSGVTLEVGGAMLAPEVAHRVADDLGCRLTQWYGMAEGFLCFTRLDDRADVVLSTQGRPLCDADEVRIVDEHGEDVGAGQTGECLVRGPYTLRGYYRADEYNTTAFTRDGFYRTGDLVRMTPEGNLVVEGRVKDNINRGGEKIAAGEVEGHLVAHPDIRAAAVVAIPDRALGEKTFAVLVANRPIGLGEIHRFLSERGVAAYKFPDRLDIVDELPRTSVGKVDKRALRVAIETAGASPR